MYEDFKFLNYWQTKHKLNKLEELMSRLLADAKIKARRIDNLKLPTIGRIDEGITLPDLIVKDITLTDLGDGVFDIAYIVKNNEGQKTESTCSGRISSLGIGNKISVIPMGVGTPFVEIGMKRKTILNPEFDRFFLSIRRGNWILGFWTNSILSILPATTR